MAQIDNDRALELTRDPRRRDPAYMAWISELPCFACMVQGRVTWGVHVAHVRMAVAEAGWRETGMGEKPSDRRTVPLCPNHHVHGKAAQHNMGERRFWAELCICPSELVGELNTAFEKKAEGYLMIARVAANARRAIQDRGCE